MVAKSKSIQKKEKPKATSAAELQPAGSPTAESDRKASYFMLKRKILDNDTITDTDGGKIQKC